MSKLGGGDGSSFPGIPGAAELIARLAVKTRTKLDEQHKINKQGSGELCIRYDAFLDKHLSGSLLTLQLSPFGVQARGKMMYISMYIFFKVVENATSNYSVHKPR